MFQKYDEQDCIEPREEDIPEGDPERTTILPPMPTWMAEGKDPPESAVMRRRRPVRSVVFAFESIANRLPDRRVA